MKQEKIDFDEIKKGMNEFKSHPITKLAVGTVVTVVVIFGVGKLMRLLAGTISDYKALRGAIDQKPFPPKTN